MQISDRIIVALDVENGDKALGLVSRLVGTVGLFKIGPGLFLREGPGILSRVSDLGGIVFLDLKFHDIPTTVARAVKAVVPYGIRILTLHTSGGKAMMEKASETAGEFPYSQRPLLLGVTVLTSLETHDLRRIWGFEGSLQDQAVHLALMAKNSGLDGVIASPLEISAIREACGEKFLIITPGIRPPNSPPDDQRRTLTAREAIEKGADYVVVGRPIIEAGDPVRAVRQLIEEPAFHGD
ncbi:MAG: orotidine-5'-phosphate decarboxylase [Armatimonadetes bacterium]|nr:orotidine-5'-phosphate decarboxylase [Armatimonadota bacterium]